MTAKDLVARYDIRSYATCDPRWGMEPGELQICNTYQVEKDGKAAVIAEIRNRRVEILSYLTQEEEET